MGTITLLTFYNLWNTTPSTSLLGSRGHVNSLHIPLALSCKFLNR